MTFGNKIGAEFTAELSEKELFSPEYGALILEVSAEEAVEELFEGLDFKILGTTIKKEVIIINGIEISLAEALKSWEEPLEKIYKTEIAEDEIAELFEEDVEKELLNFEPYQSEENFSSQINIAKPKVVIPVFPGTNCEYDSARQFREAGAEVETLIFKNLEPQQIENSIEKMAALIRNAQILMLPGGFSAGDEPDGSGKFIAAVFRNPEIKAAVMELLDNRDGLMLGICNGFQALVKLGLLPYGEIRDLTKDSPTLTYNTIGRHVSQMVNTKIVSNNSPWLANVELGDIHSIPVSHGEGRFVAEPEMIKKMQQKGQIITQYVDLNGMAAMEIPDNPNGSIAAVEGICSPDGRVFGKMGHSERIGNNVAKNIIGKKDQKLFEAGVDYFRK